MAKTNYSRSRRATSWDGAMDNLTPQQEYLNELYKSKYTAAHPKPCDSEEYKLINSHQPRSCPFCGSLSIIKFCIDGNKVQRYRCKECGKRFNPTTGTIFDSRKIPVSEWVEYSMNLFRYLSLNADSWNNRNSVTTSRYWLEKVFIALKNYQEGIILQGDVWLDETYYSLMLRDRHRNEDGSYPRGLSKNKICIGVATDKKWTVCFVEGASKPSKAESFQTFASHIKSGSTLFHDMDNSHSELIEKPGLNSIEYDSSTLKGLDDEENPLDPVNNIHDLLKRFLHAHSGFSRSDLQGYLNLFAFTMNPPSEHVLKVDELLNLAFDTHEMLRYREFYKVKSKKGDCETL